MNNEYYVQFAITSTKCQKVLLRIQEINFKTYISYTNWLKIYYACPSHVLTIKTLIKEPNFKIMNHNKNKCSLKRTIENA